MPYSGIAFKSFFNSVIISSVVSKRRPQIALLSLLKSQKMHGAKSSEYSGCVTI